MKKQKRNTTKVQQGCLLISEPFLPDQNFKRSVVLMCEHNEEGSAGFVLNDPMGIPLKEVLSDLPVFDTKIYSGGPVQTDTLHFLHTLGDELEDSIRVMEGVYWGGNFETLKILLGSKRIKPDQVKFFLGYSGWSPGQIDDEMEMKSWIITKGVQADVFTEDADELWKTVLRNMGKEYEIVANFPEDPNLN